MGKQDDSTLGLGDALAVCMRKYFDRKGRASRREFWYWTFFVAIVSAVLLMPTLVTGALATGVLKIEPNFDELAVVEGAELVDEDEGPAEAEETKAKSKKKKNSKLSPQTLLFQFGANKKQAQLCAIVFLACLGCFAVFELAVLCPTIAVSIRRLHDIDRAGWNLLWVLSGVGVPALAIAACLPSTLGDNKFGERPR